jgi:nucleotidyltransferase substrate binding protein (TIGR01987 family)
MPNDRKEDIRWKQRFENFEKAFHLYQRISHISEPSEAEIMGLVQAFEIAFELSWKVLKDYLEEQGFALNSPRQTLKQAYQSELLQDGHLWLEALEHRNQTVHLYDETKLTNLLPRIQSDYVKMIAQLYERLKHEL